LPTNSCFTLKQQVNYVAAPSHTTPQLLIGFPTKIHVLHELYKALNTGIHIMKNLLFERLRTQLKLVYGISVNAIVNSCGASIQIEVFVNSSSAKKVIKEIMAYLKKYKKELVPRNHFKSVKTNAKLIARNLSITPDSLAGMFLDKYMNQIQEPNKQINTLQEDLNDINAVTIQEIKELYNEIFIDDHILLVYQSNKNLRISEKHLTI
jgi:predicted Zn-dependent peptidase